MGGRATHCKGGVGGGQGYPLGGGGEARLHTGMGGGGGRATKRAKLVP